MVMPRLTDDDLSAWIVEASRDLAEVAAIAGSRASVPACPGWTMRQLVAHVISGLSGWYMYNITHGAARLDYAAAWDSRPALPPGNAERLVRLVEAADEFAELVASTDLDAPCQVFQSRRTARAWLQRAATETAIHLHDAQEVLGEVEEWRHDRAAGSIDETLRIMWHGALLLKGDLEAHGVPDAAITITATDLGLAWHVRTTPHDFVVEPLESNETPSGLSVSAGSHDFIAWLWGRTPTSRLAVTGELDQIDGWNLSANIKRRQAQVSVSSTSTGAKRSIRAPFTPGPARLRRSRLSSSTRRGCRSPAPDRAPRAARARVVGDAASGPGRRDLRMRYGSGQRRSC